MTFEDRVAHFKQVLGDKCELKADGKQAALANATTAYLAGRALPQQAPVIAAE